MHETMGQIIKRLRKERGLTQESLAERLGVTFQAVSKWETDAGMPDVSQIVPLANAFGVRTDVLFGLEGRDEGGEVQEIIRSAYRLIDGPDDRDGLLRCYQALLEGLKRYPCQPALLLQALEAGASLAYPENVCYDGENGRRIYLECVKHASLVIRYARSAADVLRAHMLLVLLHAAYGNSEAAEEHAEQFPVRADMTVYAMRAVLAHFRNDRRAESAARRQVLAYQTEALLDGIAALAGCYAELGQNDDAWHTQSAALDWLGAVFRDEAVPPVLYVRERGNLYALAADVCLKAGKPAEALRLLRELAAREQAAGEAYANGRRPRSALLRDTDVGLVAPRLFTWRAWRKKLNTPAFDGVRETDDFKALAAYLDRRPADE